MTDLPEKLAPGIYRVDGLGIKYAVSVYLIAERDGWTLIDTALESLFHPEFAEAADPSKVG